MHGCMAGVNDVNAIVFWGWPQFSKTVNHGHSHCAVEYDGVAFSPLLHVLLYGLCIVLYNESP